jgi:hypothetical protein
VENANRSIGDGAMKQIQLGQVTGYKNQRNVCAAIENGFGFKTFPVLTGDYVGDDTRHKYVITYNPYKGEMSSAVQSQIRCYINGFNAALHFAGLD